jgi:SMC interacting uncharacterized protein involved in chromosome segregation
MARTEIVELRSRLACSENENASLRRELAEMHARASSAAQPQLEAELTSTRLLLHTLQAELDQRGSEVRLSVHGTLLSRSSLRNGKHWIRGPSLEPVLALE